MSKTLKDGLTLEEMQEQGYISKDVELDDVLEVYYSGNSVQGREVTIGFDDVEERYKAYKDREYIVRAAEHVKMESIYDGPAVLIQSMYDRCELRFFDSEESVMQELDRLESSGLLPIDSEITEFEKKLEELNVDTYGINIKVLPEHNNGGHFHSYQVENYGTLLLDNCFVLDEERAMECSTMINSLGKEVEGFHIEGIEKERDSIGFNRYYNVTFKKEDFEATQEVAINPLMFPQGQTRNTLDVIIENVDFDSLREEYQEWKVEELSLDQELEKLKEVTEKLEECNNIDKELAESLELTEEKKITR